MTSKTKVRKIGNSSGIMLPKKIIESLNIQLGEELNLTIEGNALIITKLKTLEELLETVPENLDSEELDSGDDLGLEVIES